MQTVSINTSVKYRRKGREKEICRKQKYKKRREMEKSFSAEVCFLLSLSEKADFTYLL